MIRDWESVLLQWGRAPGTPEQTKMENTESQIRAAIAASSALTGHTIVVVAQGSYKNLTHIPRESDVDIRVVCRDAMFTDLSFVDSRVTTDPAIRAQVRQRFNLSDSAYAYATFRDDVGKALVARFGPAPNVTAGDKAFGIRETSYHVDADVVAALEHRRYNADGTWEEGIEFVTRKGRHIINWPEQQFRNGVAKNKLTGERFKAMVRVLKNLRAEMEDQGKAAAKPIPSFLSECLVWNVPNERFGHTTYFEDLKEVLRFLFHATKTEAGCSQWHEESDLKWLFKGDKGWTREAVNAFILAAWQHVGFTN